MSSGRKSTSFQTLESMWWLVSSRCLTGIPLLCPLVFAVTAMFAIVECIKSLVLGPIFRRGVFGDSLCEP